LKYTKLTAFLLVLAMLSMTGCGLFRDPEDIISSITELEEVPEEETQTQPAEEEKKEEKAPKVDKTIAYPAYLEELQMFRTEILGYYWQHGYAYNEKEKRTYGKDTPRPVAIRDVTGDGMPELIYVVGVRYPTWEDYYTTELRICTYQNGHILRLYQDQWDEQSEEGFGYMLFTSKKDDYLHAYIRKGSDDVTSEFVHFEPDKDGLFRIVSDLKKEVRDGNTRYFIKDGGVGADQFNESLQKLYKRMSRCLMYGDVTGDSMVRDQVASLKTVHRTYSEAVVFLGGKEDEDAKAVEAAHRGNVVKENKAEVPEEEEEMTEEDYLREAREEVAREMAEEEKQKKAEAEKKKQEEEARKREEEARKQEEAKKQEEEKKKEQSSSGDHAISYSSSHRLTEEELKGVSNNHLQMAINEIYARHGYKFKSDDIRKYFQQYSWYKPDETDMNKVSGRLNSTEKANVELMSAMMNR
jgi:hypothetical protein